MSLLLNEPMKKAIFSLQRYNSMFLPSLGTLLLSDHVAAALLSADVVMALRLRLLVFVAFVL